MKNIWLLLIFFSQVLFATESNAVANNIDVPAEDIQQLVDTLEAEPQRKKFIKHLKTLVEIKQQEKPGSPLLDKLNIERHSGTLLDSIFDALNEFGLSDSGADSFLRLFFLALLLIVLIVINGVVARYLNRVFDRFRRKFNLAQERFRSFFTLQRWFGYVLASLMFVFALGHAFGQKSWLFINDEDLINIATQLLDITLLIFLFMFIWESVKAFMEALAGDQRVSGNARLETLVPVLRNVVLVVLSVLGVLVGLSEIGVDIMPLLAGAGVFGIAIGFGAQTLFKDFITGITIIFEDLVQIGDVVTVGNRTGRIEKITIRKIQLRALDGTVNTVPFGEIAIVDNLTKEFSYYLMDIGIAYREDVDEVISCLKEIDEQMRQEEAFKNIIIEPLEVFGVDKFANSAVIIKARIKTQPIQQWTVGREFNRRMKMAFDKRGIEIPFPHQTLYFGEGKDGSAPSAKIQLQTSQYEKES